MNSLFLILGLLGAHTPEIYYFHHYMDTGHTVNKNIIEYLY